MKKLLIIISAILSITPFNALAYSNYIIPGGENIGIEIDYKGILVVGFYEIDNKYNKNDLQVGDYILEVDGVKVNTVNELVDQIDKSNKDGKVKLKVLSGELEKEIDFKLVLKNNVYKTGLYVKDSISGIGTLTYIDNDTFGCLGHEIIESSSKQKVEAKNGSIFESSVKTIDRSINGQPGTKNARFYTNNKYGTITKNTEVGVYGKYTDELKKEKVEVGKPSELKLGKATILTVLDKETVKEYEIKITKIDQKHKIKNIYFEVTDKDLLEKTGGVVQGMSGSPIMQDGKIFGAVTHVVVENVKKGYGIFITTMLEEGERENID